MRWPADSLWADFISPTHLRWFILAVFLLVLFRKRLQEERVILRRLDRFVLENALGGFNMFLGRSPLQARLISGSSVNPIIVIAGSFISSSPLQALGILVGLASVLCLLEDNRAVG